MECVCVFTEHELAGERTKLLKNNAKRMVLYRKKAWHQVHIPREWRLCVGVERFAISTLSSLAFSSSRST
eukprot:5070646-Amphidinium_carterae.1